MNQPDLQQIRMAVAREPENAELHYLLGAELAQLKEYDAAVVEMSTALALDPALHYARFQLGLLYLTMARPNQSMETWAPLDGLEAGAALRSFKLGMEALIRDDFATCVDMLRQGMAQNTQNAPLNRDIAMVIDRVNEALASTAGKPPDTPAVKPASTAPVRTDFSLYGDGNETKH